MKTPNSQQPHIFWLRSSFSALLWYARSSPPCKAHLLLQGGVRVSFHSSSSPQQSSCCAALLGGLPTHLISALLAARVSPGISYLLLQKHTMFHVCFVGANPFLPSYWLKATTNTCHSFGGQHPNCSLGASWSQRKPMFLCLLSTLPLAKAQPSVCPGVCVLELATHWQVPKHGLETKSGGRSSTLGRLMTFFWYILVQKATCFESQLAGQLSKEESWWQHSFLKQSAE